MFCAGPCSKISHGQVGVCGTAPATTGLSTGVTHFPLQGKLKVYRLTRSQENYYQNILGPKNARTAADASQRPALVWPLCLTAKLSAM